MTGWIVKQKYFSHKGPEMGLNLDCGLIFESKILPFVSLVYCAWFWYKPKTKEWNMWVSSFQTLQILPESIMLPVTWPGVVGGRLVSSEYQIIIIMSPCITFILLSWFIIFIFIWIFYLTGWNVGKEAKWTEAVATGKVWCFYASKSRIRPMWFKCQPPPFVSAWTCCFVKLTFPASRIYIQNHQDDLSSFNVKEYLWRRLEDKGLYSLGWLMSLPVFRENYFTFAIISFAQNTSHSSAERDPSPFSSISENTLFLSSGVG